MKRICEIYDISKDYEMPTGTTPSMIIYIITIRKGKLKVRV